MQDGAVGAQVESLLERHIGSNTCPVCFELMAGKQHQPMLLFPCGHTFCAAHMHDHVCRVNYRAAQAEKLKEDNPKLAGQKLERL